MQHTTADGARPRRLPTGQRQRTIERIGAQIKPQPNGCWLWNGRGDTYGQALERGENIKIHRFVYKILVGPIAEGHDIHHKCETPGCCNPAHLVALTRKEHKAAHRELRRELRRTLPRAS